MGPHFFKCGKSVVLDISTGSSRGFNGAALFQVRKGVSHPNQLNTHQGLQWGRTFSSAESALYKHSGRVSRYCFNGAALFQVRKAPLPPLATAASYHASMGPHFFKCGKLCEELIGLPILQRFNGAALFQVRKESLISFGNCRR